MYYITCYHFEMELKDKAIALRKEGKTYREIQSVVPVAKSTLSLWLRSVGLARKQQQRISEKRLSAARRGAAARRSQRLREKEALRQSGTLEIGTLSERDLWLIGTALHWSEGSKQNNRSPSAGVAFGNMDLGMIRTYLAWLKQLGVRDDDLVFELYIHAVRASEAKEFTLWWAMELKISEATIRTYFKQGSHSTNRKNTGDLYRGLMRIKVRGSTSLNRKIHGWFEGIASSFSN